MNREFRLPDLGEGITEGQVVRVLVREGERVIEDQPLLEVETDKASVEIPSPHTGIVAGVHVTENQVVNVGDVLITFDTNGGTEPVAVEVKPTAAPAAGRTPTAPAPAHPATRGTKAASPAVRKLARTLGVDLQAVDGSGPGGRVTREDVEKASAVPAVSSTPTPAAATPTPPEAADDETWGPIVREPLSRARKAIAQAMIRSVSTIPHATDTDDADVTDLDKLRRDGRGDGSSERKLSILPFVIRATVLALEKYPIFNASYDALNEQVVRHRYTSIAIGVHTDRGLIAPVLRNADRLTIPQIADGLADLAEKTRTGSFEVNDTRGGTFTISNAGAVGGSRYSIPIINYPQSAILALGRTRRQPWVVDGDIVVRLILPLSLSFDHRLIDGADEIRFMQEIIGLLEDPARLML
ncbi:MAG: 2-oxo acid dehydrogenase subunit E2 [Planctomycetes bacterium]|nr:2-oxo acid dehydrogenase subunit E2 [Planctomycetota bacterium]